MERPKRLVLEGAAAIALGDRTFELDEGDRIYLDRSVHHRYMNGSREIVRLLAIVTLPTF